jgi:hypothetical protein
VKIFAYGSNLTVQRLRGRVGEVRILGAARLDRHALRFHKRGKDGSGKADAFFTDDPADRVWGVVYEIDPSRKPDLDRVEMGYREKEVDLATESGGKIRAQLYIASPGTIDAALKPFTWYRDLALNGARAHGLPGSYVERIARVESIEDPDREREARNRP